MLNNSYSSAKVFPQDIVGSWVTFEPPCSGHVHAIRGHLSTWAKSCGTTTDTPYDQEQAYIECSKPLHSGHKTKRRRLFP